MSKLIIAAVVAFAFVSSPTFAQEWKWADNGPTCKCVQTPGTLCAAFTDSNNEKIVLVNKQNGCDSKTTRGYRQVSATLQKNGTFKTRLRGICNIQNSKCA